MGGKKRRKGVCVYCGKEKEKGQMTEHHVPPECLFAPNARRNLIKVPCCITCHRSFSEDDEYFKLVYVIRHDVASHPDVQELIPGVVRSLYNPKKVGYTRAFLRTVRKVNPVTPRGLLLPTTGAYIPQMERIERVIRRTVIGLFYHETERRLPDNYDVLVISADALSHIDSESLQQWRRNILLPVAKGRPRIFGRNVFGYKVLLFKDDPNVSAWILAFYERIAFICATLKKDDTSGMMNTMP